MKRIFLFLVTNIAVLLVLGTVLSLLGVDSLLSENGVDLDTGNLLVFAAVFGMGGSFISLAMSKWMARRAVGARVIETPANDAEQWLVNKVGQHAQAAGIGMPEVALWYAPVPNAFATGARRDHALVAVSTGLLRGMRPDEVDAVLGHEIGHVANGDMVTLALIQGVVNTFVIFLSRVVGHFVDRVLLRNERGYGLGYYGAVIASQLFFSVLASIVVMYFSRYREFRADAEGARLAGRDKMIAALERLKQLSGESPQPLPEPVTAFGISGNWKSLFATHPSLDARIEALRSAR